MMIGLDKGSKYVELYLFRRGPKLGLNARTPFGNFAGGQTWTLIHVLLSEILQGSGGVDVGGAILDPNARTPFENFADAQLHLPCDATLNMNNV